MARVAAIHYAAGHVDAGAGHVRAIVHIRHLIDRAAIHTHAEFELRMTLQSLRDLQRTSHGRVWTGEKGERHSVSSGQPHQFAYGFRRAELFRPPDDLIQLTQKFALPIDRQLGITDDVREQDMRDFELRIVSRLSGHVAPVSLISAFLCHE
ncbi:MAG: hypothetical protein M3505_10395 [Verrucomicrobiota bacterium]|nr:hypothetical protein [Verrucomicrobiota bacterium]